MLHIKFRGPSSNGSLVLQPTTSVTDRQSDGQTEIRNSIKSYSGRLNIDPNLYVNIRILAKAVLEISCLPDFSIAIMVESKKGHNPVNMSQTDKQTDRRTDRQKYGFAQKLIRTSEY